MEHLLQLRMLIPLTVTPGSWRPYIESAAETFTAIVTDIPPRNGRVLRVVGVGHLLRHDLLAARAKHADLL